MPQTWRDVSSMPLWRYQGFAGRRRHTSDQLPRRLAGLSWLIGYARLKPPPLMAAMQELHGLHLLSFVGLRILNLHNTLRALLAWAGTGCRPAARQLPEHSWACYPKTMRAGLHLEGLVGLGRNNAGQLPGNLLDDHGLDAPAHQAQDRIVQPGELAAADAQAHAAESHVYGGVQNDVGAP